MRSGVLKFDSEAKKLKLEVEKNEVGVQPGHIFEQSVIKDNLVSIN